MPSRLFDINLQSAEFPFLSTDINRTTILADIPEPLPYNSNVVRPQVIYMKDTLPSKYGYDSLDKLLPFQGTVAGQTFQKVIPFFDINDAAHYLGITQNSYWIADDGITQWRAQQTGFTTSTVWSYVRLDGYPFFHPAGGSIYYYDAGTDLLVAATVSGVTAANLHGITGAAGYMIAWDATNIYYTTAINTGISPFTIDFTPALGVAGTYEIQDLRGLINTVLPIQNGFIVYSKENAVGNTYSGNPDFPFNSAEILGSSGVLTDFQVVGHENLGYHYAWTENGLQQVAISGATNIFPELFDFTQMKTTESINVSTGVITRTISTDTYAVRLALLGKRFLCISYGPLASSFPQNYVEAVIYDVDLKRWGKIVQQHTQIFAYTFISAVQYETYNDLSATTYNALSATTYAQLVVGVTKQLGYIFGLLQSNGQIYSYSRSNLLDGTNNAQSVLIFGRIKFYKVGTQEVQELYVDQFSGSCYLYNAYTDSPLKVDLVQAASDITLESPSQYARRYGFDCAGYWQQFVFSGKYHFTTVSAMINRGGKY